MPNISQKLGQILNSLGGRLQGESQTGSGLGFSRPASSFGSDPNAGMSTGQFASAMGALATAIPPLTQQIQLLVAQMQGLNNSLQQKRGGAGGGAGGVVVTPTGNVASPGGSGGFLSNILSNAQWTNFSPQGLVNSAIAQLPTMWGAAAAGGMLLTNTAISANLAYSEPIFQTETSLMAASRSGTYVNPIERNTARRSAEIEGTLGYARAWGGLWDWLGPVRYLHEGVYRGMERNIELVKASGRNMMTNRAIAAYGGAVSLNIDDDTLEGQLAGVRASAGFGRSAVRGAQGYGYEPMLRRFGIEGVEGAFGTLSGMASDYRFTNVRSAFGVGDIQGAAGAALSVAAASGNFGAIRSLMPFFGDDRNALNTAIARANQAADISGGLSIGQSALGFGQSALSYLQATGAGYGAIQAQTNLIGGSVSSQMALLSQQRNLWAGNPIMQAQIDAQMAQMGAMGAEVYRYGVEAEFSQRGTSIGAARLTAGLTTRETLYGGGDESALSSAYSGEVRQARRQARLLREMARSDIYDPATREMYATQASEFEQQASLLLPRQLSFEQYGIASGRAGLSGATASLGMTTALLFGGANDVRAAGGQQVGAIREQISSLVDLLARGNLSLREQLDYQRQIVDLRKQEVEAGTQSARTAAQMSMAVAGGTTDIAALGAQRGFLQGVGGVAGVGLASGVARGRAGEVRAAQDYVNLLRQQGVADNSPQMVDARRAVEAARTGQTQAELGMSQTPFSLGLRSALSGQEYTAQVLSSVPGAYGNLRGALQGQLSTLNKMSQELQQQEAAALQNASPENRAALEFEFQQRRQQIGLQEAAVSQQLSYGWESRLISNVLGAPGNFSGQMNRFSYMRSVLNGARNPLFGSNSRDLPGYLQNAMYPGSIAGATGTPEGFAITAMVGARGRDSGPMPIPNYAGSDMTSGRDKVVIEIILRNPDGSQIGRGTVSATRGGTGILGNLEDISNLLVQQNSGNN